MKKISLILFLFLFPFLIPALATAAPGDTLYIAEDEVAIWSGPNEEGPIKFTLKMNHELYEFGRELDWVFVSIQQTNSKSGWVHSSRLSEVSTGPFPSYSVTASFEQFKAEVEALDAMVNPHPDLGLYRKIEYLEGGIVQLIVTNSWLEAPFEERKMHRDYLYKLWVGILDDTLPVKLPKVSVRLADSRGNLIMIINENE